MASFTSSVIRINDVVPDFVQESTQGPIKFHEFIEGSWAILFSHPKAFTPICTTELGTVAKLQGEFAKRGVKCLAVSIDSVEDNAGWIPDIEKYAGVPVTYPILADVNHSVCTKYNMLMEDETVAGTPATVRSVFIIGPDKKLKITFTYPPSVGRNFDEVLRCVDALQVTSKAPLTTPVNWKNGEKAVIAPSVKSEDAAVKYPGYTEVLPYLRYTPEGIDVNNL